jgi:hypothetical protein
MTEDDEPLFDQNVANAAAAIDSCMKLGAVILKPKNAPTFGFSTDVPMQPQASARES